MARSMRAAVLSSATTPRMEACWAWSPGGTRAKLQASAAASTARGLTARDITYLFKKLRVMPTSENLRFPPYIKDTVGAPTVPESNRGPDADG